LVLFFKKELLALRDRCGELAGAGGPCHAIRHFQGLETKKGARLSSSTLFYIGNLVAGTRNHLDLLLSG
jgi:hypothetical protein